MANEQQQKTKTKAKVVDKWKLKSWYTILAPEIFDSKEIGQLVATEESTLPNRIIRAGLGELSGQMSQLSTFTVVNLRVTEVRGKSVATKIIGHELATAYTRTLVRRRHSVINEVDDIVTKDGVPVRIKMLGLSANRVSEAARTAMRHAMGEEVKKLAKEMEFNALFQDILFGRFAAKIFSKVKKITPMRRIEVRKTEVGEKFN